MQPLEEGQVRAGLLLGRSFVGIVDPGKELRPRGRVLVRPGFGKALRLRVLVGAGRQRQDTSQ